MNDTTKDKDELLETLNNEKALLMVPVFVYLAVLMIAGTVGNALVCYFYGRKSRRSSNTVFILGVAMYDLILCTVSIPIEFVDIRFFYNFPYTVPCKVMRFVTYFAAVGSVFTLLVISIDRYRKICRPFKKQVGVREAKIACGISVLFSAMFSWPAAVFYTSVPVDIVTKEGEVLQGFDCTTTRENSYKLYLWIFNGFYLLCFFISTVILFVMYGLVGKALYKHHKLQSHSTRSKSSHECGSGIDSTNHREQTTVTVKAVRFTQVMFVITLVFVLSFLPHLALSLWRAFQAKYEGESLTGSGLVAFQIGLRSYFLNSAINPLTYGFFNSRFRAFFYLKCCPCCKRISVSHPVSSSTGTTIQFQMHSLTSN